MSKPSEQTPAATQATFSGQGLSIEDFIDSLTFVDGLIPVVAQQHDSNKVLMLAYMNAEAIEATLNSGFVTYFSRSRQQLWRKGETSGNLQRLIELAFDCDADTLLVKVDQTGPACHTGTETCFTDRTFYRLDA